jgi:hypothetical protein
MGKEQWRKLDVVERIERGQMTIAEGAEALGLSTRQVQRIRKRVVGEGVLGVKHGNTGRRPKHSTPVGLRALVSALRRGKYQGFNDEHFSEKLREVEKIDLSRSTVRRILREAGIAAERKRRRTKHRRRRDRRPQAGQMILWDGSRHDWLEGRGPRMCLMGAIDDATGELLPGAHFVDQECTVGYLRVLRDIVMEKGIPLTAYMDRHGSLKRNDKHWSVEEQLRGRQEPTQVKRALDDLGIQAIYALSPQAKGRVERLWGTLQDRLVSELRLVGASTAADANRVLKAYRSEHNARFAIAPQDSHYAWRPAPDKATAEMLCGVHHIRKVANNNTVRIGKQVIDIPKRAGAPRATYAKTYVTVRHLLDGGYRLYFQGELIAKARSKPPVDSPAEVRSVSVREARLEKVRARREEEL